MAFSFLPKSVTLYDPELLLHANCRNLVFFEAKYAKLAAVMPTVSQ